VGRGEVVGLLGPNGAGKTTLLKILTGLFEPEQGTVRIGGVDVVQDPVAARALLGYLPESAPLYPEMLVQESLLWSAELRGLAGAERLRKLGAAVEAAGLGGVLTQPIGTLSKGFRQRVGLAQAILHEPPVLILDEPTSGLDPAQIAEVRKLLGLLAARSTIILSTHILSEVELTCARVLVLIGGELRADARLQELGAGNRFRLELAPGAAAEPVLGALRALPGVLRAGPEPAAGAGIWLEVEGRPGEELGARLFEAARAQAWPLRQLRQEGRTLESFFRAVAAGQEVRR
ncbi:MAG TPA: ATP-binding cassette domain-containing protein, partial [Myxococcota bacterium]|nr:ATP-binding cassette domain-containing protein [Myxococcota bacterium]